LSFSEMDRLWEEAKARSEAPPKSSTTTPPSDSAEEASHER